jgi:protein-S-isoprenylcysteine O-methyltransferase Ste14
LSSLELRVPPPAVAVVAAILMWLAAQVFPALDFQLPAGGVLAVALVVIGVLIGATAFVQFRRAGTTPDPRTPQDTVKLVTSGLYRFSRNPMYLGDVLILAGWTLWLANALAFVGPPLFIAYIDRFQILPEESVLAARFGAAYAEYCRAVRRWL